MRSERDAPTVVGHVEEAPRAPERPSRGLVLAAITVVVILIVLGLGNRRPDPAPVAGTDDLPSPVARDELVRMPGLVGRQIDEVTPLLIEAGFGEGVPVEVRWIANQREPVGTVYLQEPSQDVIVPASAPVAVQVSAGGPILGFDSLPGYVQALVDRSFDREEPILVTETSAGPAYKTDELLFGACDSVEQADRLYRDETYEVACPASDATWLIGWLPDGTAFEVNGLRPGRRLPTEMSGVVMIDLPDGSSLALGVPTFRRTPRQQSASVVRAGNLLSIVSDRWHSQIALFDEVLAVLSDDQIEALSTSIAASTTDEHLILSLAPPLRFQTPHELPTFLGVTYGDLQVAAGCLENRLTICDPTGQISVSFPDQESTADVSISIIDAGPWQRLDAGGIELVYPENWTVASESLTPDLLSPAEVASLGTYPLRPGGRLCSHVPEQALRDLGPTDALISIQVEGARARAKPDQFGEASLGRFEGHTDAHVCAERLDLDIRWHSFDVQGRGTRFLVAFGSEVDLTTKSSAWAILNSFGFSD